MRFFEDRQRSKLAGLQDLDDRRGLGSTRDRPTPPDLAGHCPAPFPL